SPWAAAGPGFPGQTDSSAISRSDSRVPQPRRNGFESIGHTLGASPALQEPLDAGRRPIGQVATHLAFRGGQARAALQVDDPRSVPGRRGIRLVGAPRRAGRATLHGGPHGVLLGLPEGVASPIPRNSMSRLTSRSSSRMATLTIAWTFSATRR